MAESSLGDLRRLGKDGGEAKKKGGESSAQLHKRKRSERSELSLHIHRRDSLSLQYT